MAGSILATSHYYKMIQRDTSKSLMKAVTEYNCLLKYLRIFVGGHFIYEDSRKMTISQKWNYGGSQKYHVPQNPLIETGLLRCPFWLIERSPFGPLSPQMNPSIYNSVQPTPPTPQSQATHAKSRAHPSLSLLPERSLRATSVFSFSSQAARWWGSKWCSNRSLWPCVRDSRGSWLSGLMAVRI